MIVLKVLYTFPVEQVQSIHAGKYFIPFPLVDPSFDLEAFWLLLCQISSKSALPGADGQGGL